MNRRVQGLLGVLFVTAGMTVSGAPAMVRAGVVAGAQSAWVHLDPHGKLVYKSLPQGDKIMDFSSAGYGGGGVRILQMAVKRTVSPLGEDSTTAIQSALDAVGQMPLVNGVRGAILLQPGTFTCQGPLRIRTSGVVLRGSGDGPGGTTLKMAGTPHVCLSITGSGSADRQGSPTAITDSYVPSGAMSFQVADASQFHRGDTILIHRPVTAAWVAFMGMDTLVRNGRKETWLSGTIDTERTIKGVAGNEITLDLPLTDSFDSRYLNPPGGSVVKTAFPGRITEVGVENLHIVSPPQSIGINEPQYEALRMNAVTDGWVRNIAVDDTINSVHIGPFAKRVTVDNVRITHRVTTKGAAKPADFAVDGTQVLLNQCSSRGNNLFYFVTGARATGPNVLLNCAFYGNGHIAPHQRWATGLLIDGCRVPDSGIDLMNRGEMGSGHGWTIAWSVVWNCVARSFVVQQPPGAANWAIGCEGARETSPMPFGQGPKLPEGIYDSQGTPVLPKSLYLAQLRERRGPMALRNIGY